MKKKMRTRREIRTENLLAGQVGCCQKEFPVGEVSIEAEDDSSDIGGEEGGGEAGVVDSLEAEGRAGALQYRIEARIHGHWTWTTEMTEESAGTMVSKIV